MTPERENEIRKALSHYTEPYEFHWALLATKDLLAEIDRLRKENATLKQSAEPLIYHAAKLTFQSTDGIAMLGATRW